MEASKKFLIAIIILQAIVPYQASIPAAPADSNLFREYIGAEFNNVRFTDVPINPRVDFHFILSFAIDYDTSDSPSPTNGKFNVFWDTTNLGPSQVSSIKSDRSNVKVALSLGGDSVQGGSVYFKPSSVESWVSNAVSSLTTIIQQYNLDGIDIDYEHFQADPETFAECIGQLVSTLKKNVTNSVTNDQFLPLPLGVHDEDDPSGRSQSASCDKEKGDAYVAQGKEEEISYMDTWSPQVSPAASRAFGLNQSFFSQLGSRNKKGRIETLARG